MELSPEISVLIDDLVKSTRNKKAEWEHARGIIDNALAENDFLLNADKFSVNVYQTNENAKVYINLLNEKGEIIYSFGATEYEYGYEKLLSLFNVARESVYNIDGAVEYLRNRFKS